MSIRVSRHCLAVALVQHLQVEMAASRNTLRRRYEACGNTSLWRRTFPPPQVAPESVASLLRRLIPGRRKPLFLGRILFSPSAKKLILGPVLRSSRAKNDFWPPFFVPGTIYRCCVVLRSFNDALRTLLVTTFFCYLPSGEQNTINTHIRTLHFEAREAVIKKRTNCIAE